MNTDSTGGRAAAAQPQPQPQPGDQAAAEPGDQTVAGDRTVAGEALYGLISAAVRRGPREMSLTSMSTLATLDRSGPRRVTDLAFIEGVAQPSMTTLVSALERSGLVERRSDPADKRVALIALTPAGAELLRSRRRAGAEALVQLIDKLPAAEAAALAAAVPALRRLRELDNAEREPATRPAAGGSQ